MSSTQLVVTGSMNLLGETVVCVCILMPTTQQPSQNMWTEKESDNTAKHLGSGIPVVVTEQSIVNILTQCTRQVMLLHMHKCSSLIPRPLQVDIRLETRVSQKVGSQANTTTTMCVGHSSFMTLILCAGVIITPPQLVSYTVCAWHKLRRSLAMRLGGMIPVYSVYCTQFEL